MSKNKYIYLIISVLFSSVFYSQKADSITVIEEIVAIGKKPKEGIISYQKLSGKELENLNSVSVADAIRYFSGVQLKDYGGVGGMKTVNIRGMGTQHVGVFYDGIQLGNAQNGIIDLGKFSLDNLESISLYNGQRSQILQSAKDFGSSGSIYLVSKKPRFSENKKTNLSINYRSGSFGVINPSVLWEQKISDKLNTSLNFEYLNSDGKYKFRRTLRTPNGKIAWDTTAIRKNGNISAFRAEAGLYGKLNQGMWDVKAYYYDSDRGIPGAVIKNVYHRYEKQWDRNFFIQGSLKKEITSKYKILMNTKYAYDYTHYLNDDFRTKYTNNSYKQKEFYLSAAQQYSLFSFWDVSLSTDYQYNTLDANMSGFAYPERNTELIALATYLHFGNKIKLQASLLGTFVQEKLKNNNQFQPAQNRDEYTPAVFLNYKPFSGTDFNIYTFYKRIFRMPTFNDLYYTEIGSSTLKPEYTHQYDVGISYNKDFYKGIIKNINITADAYYNEVTDKIIAYPKGQQFRWTMVNLGKARIRGIDISAQTLWLLHRDLLFNTKLTYTYEDAQDLTSHKLIYYKDQIPYIPWNSGSLLLGIIYKDWNLNYSFIYTGERYNMVTNIPENYEKAWYTSDVSFSREISWGTRKVKAAVEINNLFNKQYEIIIGYPMPGRSYRVSLRINL